MEKGGDFYNLPEWLQSSRHAVEQKHAKNAKDCRNQDR
jgi:hypothetical protein